MKKEITQRIIRGLFSLLLIYKALPETGWWTASIFFLLFMNVELTFWISKLQSEHLKMFYSVLDSKGDQP